MGRIIAIDYGRKRCGVAVTDTLQLIAGGLPTVPTHRLEAFLTDYCTHESVDEIVVGLPQTVRGEFSESMKYIKPFIQRIGKLLPTVRVRMFDERFTSVIAHREMLAAGLKKSRRQDKSLADKTAAVLILTDYLQSKDFVLGVNQEMNLNPKP